MSSTSPAIRSASTTHDMPVVSGRLNDTMTEWAVALADLDDVDGEGMGRGR